MNDDAGVLVGLLFASCGIEPEIVSGANRETIALGVTGPVASIGHLIGPDGFHDVPSHSRALYA